MEKIRIKMVTLARAIRKEFIENGTYNYTADKELGDLAYKYNIEVYYDENNIPYGVEDEPIIV